MNMRKANKNYKHISFLIIVACLQNKQLSDPCKCIKNIPWTMTTLICKIENFLIENVKYGTNYVYTDQPYSI